MLTIRRNYGLLVYFFKRCIGNSSGNKHYEYFIKHIKTVLNNHSYIIKQTTAIPKQISYQSPVSNTDIPCTNGIKTPNNQILPGTKHAKFKIINDTGNKFLEKNVLRQDMANKLVTHYSTKEHSLNNNKYNHGRVEKVKKSCSTNGTPSGYDKKNDIFSINNNHDETIKSNYQENYFYTTQQKQIATSFLDDPINNDSNSFSLSKIKKILSNKIKDVLMTNFNANDIFTDDIVILNQKIPERESLLYFKNKDLNVIESSHTNFKNEVKNYIKKLDIIGKNRSAPERLNLIRFSKVYSSDDLFDEPLSYNSSYSKDHLSIQPDSQGNSHYIKNYSSGLISTANSWNSLYDTTLKVKNSVPLEQNTRTFWIPYEEDNGDFEQVTSQSFYKLSPHSGPPFTEKVPINKDKLIEENIVPNTSILNIINSIDKSTMIIQKDLYITDQIIQKIQKEEEEHKIIDKNKLETTAKKDHMMYLDPVKRGMVTLSVADLTAGIKTVSSNDIQEELNNSNNKESLMTTENSTKKENKPLQHRYFSNKKNVDVSQTKSYDINNNNNNKDNDSPAFVTLKSIDGDGKISLSMLYESNKVVPMLTFLSKKEATQVVAKSNISADDSQLKSSECSNNNNVNRISVSKVSSPDEGVPIDHEGNPTNSNITEVTDDNYQLSTASENRLKLMEKEFQQQKTITNECEKKSSKAYKEVPRYLDPDNRPLSKVDKSLETLIKYYILKKELSVSNDLKNKSEKQHSKEETSHITQNIIPDIVKSVEPLFKKYILKREIPVSDFPKNESEKKCSETPKEEPNQIAHHIVQIVTNSLETWLKDSIPKKGISVSNGLKNGSEKQYSETPMEESSHPTHNIVPDIVKSLETLIKDYLSKKETSISNANSPDEEIPMELSNTTNSELEAMENDSLNQEEMIHESEQKCSEQISEEEAIRSVELLPKKETSVTNRYYPVEDHEYILNRNNTETSSKNKNIFQRKNNILGNINDEQLSEDSIQEFNNKSQNTLTDWIDYPKFYSLEHSKETRSKFIINEEDTIEPSRSTTKEGSYNEKEIIHSDINSLGRESDAQAPLKNNTHSNLSTIPNNESNQPLLMKSGDILHGLSLISGNSGKGSFSGRKNDENSNKFVPTKKKFESSITNNSSVDRVKKTIISTVEQNNFTDINVSEVETYVDSRLPIPFSTETFFQIFGSNHSLRDHSSLIDVAKYRLSSPNTFMEQQSNQSVMAKLDDIRRSVQYLNILAMKSKSFESKDAVLKNKAITSKEVSERSANIKRTPKDSTKEHMQYKKTETPNNRKKETINEENVPNFIPKVSLKIFKNNNLPIRTHNLKQISKQNLLKNTSEVKKHDDKTPSKDDKSLLVIEPKSKNIKKTKMDLKKPGIQKAALTGIKTSRGKYVDLFNFNKNEKNKKHKLQGHKKGAYDHGGLSKRDKKILGEITKEIPKRKPKGKRSRRRPFRPITSKKNGNEIKQSTKSLVKKSKDAPSKITLPKKDSELVNKTVLPNTHLSNERRLLPQGKHGPKKKEVQKAFTEKIENISHKVIPRVDKKSVEKSLQSEKKKSKDLKLDKSIEKIKISEAKSTKTERFDVSKKGNLKKVTKSEKNSIKNAESENSNNDDKICKKPICQTYFATETYINQPEKTHQIPEKIFTSKKIIKKNPTPQKVTILENIKANKEDNFNTLKIHEDFKEELIRKSQNKIEHRTNIDFRVKTPKLRSPSSKVTAFKSKQTGKLSQATMFEKIPTPKKDKKKVDIKNKHFESKKHSKNKSDYASSKEIRSSKKTSATEKSALQQENIKNQLQKVNQLGLHNKETFSQTKSKTTEIINAKPFDKITKEREKSRGKEQLKIVATDKLKSPREPKPGKKAAIIDPSENINKTNFPLFLIDVDKMSKEIKPELDSKNCQKCQVAHDNIIDFPLHNQEKKLLFKPPFKILNLGPSNDPMLRNELKFFPSVTKVMNSTIPENSREILREWRKSMIDELGENGFKSYYKGQLINGNKFNWQLHNFLLSGEKLKQDSENLGLKSIENVLRKTSDLSAINSHVIHRKLAYRGVIDCVAKYQNRPVLIEWKRLENPEVKIENSSIDVASTQLSAYVGALNYDDTYKFQISGGLIVLAFNDGSEAEVIEINNEQCSKNWKKWLRRLQTYHESFRNKTA